MSVDEAVERAIVPVDDIERLLSYAKDARKQERLMEIFQKAVDERVQAYETATLETHEDHAKRIKALSTVLECLAGSEKTPSIHPTSIADMKIATVAGLGVCAATSFFLALDMATGFSFTALGTTAAALLPLVAQYIDFSSDRDRTTEDLFLNELKLTTANTAYSQVFDTDFKEGDLVLYSGDELSVGILAGSTTNSIKIETYDEYWKVTFSGHGDHVLCKLEESGEYTAIHPTDCPGIPAAVYYEDERELMGFMHRDVKHTKISKSPKHDEKSMFSYRNEALKDSKYRIVELRPAKRKEKKLNGGPYR